MAHPFIKKIREQQRKTQALTSGARWNYQPCTATRGIVIIGTSPSPSWWCAGDKGKPHRCLRIQQDGDTFYIDDEDGSGSKKVFDEGGGPNSYHRSIPVDLPDIEAFTSDA